MQDLSLEAEKQLDCLNARIVQLTDEYRKSRLAETVSRHTGTKREAALCRKRSRELIARLNYLLRQRRDSEE